MTGRPDFLSPALFAEVRRLQFQSRRLADRVTAGKYRSAFKGQGIEFEEVREYFPGDDIRSIDWKVTARSRQPYVKSYREERELSVVVAVDVSASTHTATRGDLRSTVVAKVGAVLSLIALKNNDKVGLVAFSDRVETYHPPRKARGAIWRILHEVLAPREYHEGTDFGMLYRFLNQVLKRSSIIFVLSDFLAPNGIEDLAVLGKRHDVTAVLISDPGEREFAAAGLITLRDPESSETIVIDSTAEEFRRRYAQACADSRTELKSALRKHRIGLLELSTAQPFMADIKRFFDARRTHSYYSQFLSKK